MMNLKRGKMQNKYLIFSIKMTNPILNNWNPDKTASNSIEDENDSF